VYSTVEAYEIAMGESIDKYPLREKVAVAKLTEYAFQFPTEDELGTLPLSAQENILYAIYYQIKFDSDNDLLDDNGNLTNVTIGNFQYSHNSTYGANRGVNTLYSNTALILLRELGLFDNKVTVKKRCSWLDGFTWGC